MPTVSVTVIIRGLNAGENSLPLNYILFHIRPTFFCIKFRVILSMPKKICARIFIGIALKLEINLERIDNFAVSSV